MNESFANIGSKLSSKLLEIQAKMYIDRLEKTMVLHRKKMFGGKYRLKLNEMQEKMV